MNDIECEGLMIYNTSIHCVEFWNGTKWIPRCSGPHPDTYEEGVFINGIRWATRNVDMSGKFAAKPEY
jgi:hypothetical protein